MTDPRIERLTEMVAALRQEGYNRQESIELLYARIEALEAAQQPDQIASEPQWYRLSEREPQDGDHCIYRSPPNLLHAYGIWHDKSTEYISRKGFWNNEKELLFVGDPERISWRLAMPHEIPPQPQPDHIADASKMVDTGWRNLHDLSPIMEPAQPEPAEGLVERVAWRLANLNHDTNPEIWRPEARAAIREVTGFLCEQGCYNAACLLELEANR
jgi:uncharacterized coiled-coil protein SlyX